jgi:chromosome segregation ATPase
MGRQTAISYENFLDVVRMIEQDGDRVTVRAVQARIDATPSSSTLTRYMQQWRDERAESLRQNWPETVPRSLLSGLRVFWDTAMQTADDNFQAHRADADARVAAAEQEAEAMARLLHERDMQIEQVEEGRAQLASMVDRQSERIAVGEQALRLVESQLAEKQGQLTGVQDQLKQSVAQAERLERARVELAEQHQDKIDELEKSQTQWRQQEVNRHQEEENRLMQQLATLRDTAQSRLVELKEARVQLSQLEKNLTKAEQALEKKHAELAALRTNRDETLHANRQLEARLQEMSLLKTRHEEDNQRQAEDIRRLQALLETAESSLVSERVRFERRLDSLIARLDQNRETKPE